MFEWKFLLEVVKSIGFPAVIFVIWYLYHKGQMKFLQELLEDQREREKKAFEVFDGFLETLEYHAARLSSIESKIDTNQWCPIAKKEVNR